MVIECCFQSRDLSDPVDGNQTVSRKEPSASTSCSRAGFTSSDSKKQVNIDNVFLFIYGVNLFSYGKQCHALNSFFPVIIIQCPSTVHVGFIHGISPVILNNKITKLLLSTSIQSQSSFENSVIKISCLPTKLVKIITLTFLKC